MGVEYFEPKGRYIIVSPRVRKRVSKKAYHKLLCRSWDDIEKSGFNIPEDKDMYIHVTVGIE